MVTWGLVGRGAHDGGRLVVVLGRQDAPARRGHAEFLLKRRFPCPFGRRSDGINAPISWRWTIVPLFIIKEKGPSFMAHSVGRPQRARVNQGRARQGGAWRAHVAVRYREKSGFHHMILKTAIFRL